METANSLHLIAAQWPGWGPNSAIAVRRYGCDKARKITCSWGNLDGGYVGPFKIYLQRERKGLSTSETSGPHRVKVCWLGHRYLVSACPEDKTDTAIKAGERGEQWGEVALAQTGAPGKAPEGGAGGRPPWGRLASAPGGVMAHRLGPAGPSPRGRDCSAGPQFCLGTVPLLPRKAVLAVHTRGSGLSP